MSVVSVVDSPVPADYPAFGHLFPSSRGETDLQAERLNPVASVTLNLYGGLTSFTPSREKTVTVNVADPSTAGGLLERLGVPLGMLALVLVNDERVELDAELADGDRVEAFPVCGGGSKRWEGDNALRI